MMAGLLLPAMRACAHDDDEHKDDIKLALEILKYLKLIRTGHFISRSVIGCCISNYCTRRYYFFLLLIVSNVNHSHGRR
jgi:hypothetical protein